MFVCCYRRGLILGSVFVLALSVTARADESAFKVCADPSNPPFSDQKGHGFENKIAELFAQDLGKKVEYTWFPQRLGFIRNTLKAKLPDSEEFKCDVVMGVPAGYELTATTKPYYRSTYVLVYRKGRGLDDIKAPNDLDRLPAETKAKLRIAMFDGSPGTTWLMQHQLVAQGIPYQSMSGDPNLSTAQVLEKDFADDKIDATIVWGPIAGYLVNHGNGALEMILMTSEAGNKFDFPIAMGVRFPDKERKEQLNGLIEKHADRIQALLQEYRVPLVDEQGKPLTGKTQSN